MYSQAKTRIIVPGLLLLLSFMVTSTQAQTTRVYVATSGNDANQCTDAAPCKTVTKALTVVDAGGEVIIAESGDYDAFIVSKSVTVAAAAGINAGVVTDGGSAIRVFGLQATDTVAFRNLNLKAIGDPTNTIGIGNNNPASAGTLYVDGCTLTGFNNAIVVANVAGQVFVHDTTIRNSVFGIGLIGPQTDGVLRAVIDHCKIELNDTGIVLNSKVLATIRDSILASNTSRAIQVRSTGTNQRAEALIDNCQLTHNTVGLLTGGTNGTAIARLARTTITNSLLSGVSVGANSTVYTLQNNVIAGNFPDVNGVLTALAAK